MENFDKQKYIKIKNTELIVSRIGFGTIPILKGNVNILPPYYNLENDEAVELMLQAYNAGINLFDTAVVPEYGDAEIKTGYFLQHLSQLGKRDSVIISDKARAYTGTEMEQALEISLKNLRSDYCDIYFVHQVDPNSEENVFAHGGALDVLCHYKRSGKIRYTGIATHHFSIALRAACDSRVDFVQTSGNILERGILDRIRNSKAFQRVGLFLNKVYAGGVLPTFFSPNELISFTKSYPMDCILLGIGTKQQLNDALAGWNEPDSQRTFKNTIEHLSSKIPIINCTRCQLCHCNKGVNIVHLFRFYNYYLLGHKTWASKKLLSQLKKDYNKCVTCTRHTCHNTCPQNIDIHQFILSLYRLIFYKPSELFMKHLNIFPESENDIFLYSQTKSEKSISDELFSAIDANDLVTIKRLIASGQDLNCHSNEGVTPVYRAVELSLTDIVHLLVNAGCEVNEDDRRTAPLHLAVSRNQIELATFLLEHGANASARDKQQKTPLYIAVENNNVQMTNLLLRKGKIDLLWKVKKQSVCELAKKKDYADITSLLDTLYTYRSQIMTAIKDNDLSHLRKLQIANSESSMQQLNFIHDGTTPAHLAVMTNNTDIVDFLTQGGIDWNVHNMFGQTPLCLAIEHSHYKVVQQLLQIGINVYQKTTGSKTPLQVAILHNQFEIVRLLVSQNPQLLEMTDKQGNSPLHTATSLNLSDMTNLLLELGANPFAMNLNLQTPVSMLIDNNQIQTICQIFELNPDYYSPVHTHDSVLNYMIKTDNIDMVRQLVSTFNTTKEYINENKDAILEIATQRPFFVFDYCWNELGLRPDTNLCQDLYFHSAQTGNVQTFYFLAKQYSFPVDAVDNMGQTPLHYAAQKNHADMVKYLVEHEACLEVKDELGRTPFLTAVHNNSIDVVKYLLDYGVDYNTKSVYGSGALEQAILNSYQEITSMLLTLTKDKSDIDDALSWATHAGTVSIVQLILRYHPSKQGLNDALFCVHGMQMTEIASLLIQQGADPCIKNESDFTPLHWATVCNSVSFVQLLLDSGADINAQDCFGQTALYIAVENDFYSVAKLLLSKGADVNKRVLHQGSALLVAVANENLDMVRLLIDSHANPNIRGYADWLNITPLELAQQLQNIPLITLLSKITSN